MVSFSTLHPDIKISPLDSRQRTTCWKRTGKSGATARDERNERNQKNAGISGEINVMRQFDSSRSGKKEAWVGGMKKEEGSLAFENAIVFRSRSPSRSYWFLRDAYFRNSPRSSDERPSVSLKLELIFDGKTLH